jgi:eukaryotic-like serine/threonine-protein kinase
LLDFGIAKLIADEATDESGHAQLDGIPLTPGYASPEQLAGKPVSTASDIYSLGVLLLELLTGERPRRLLRTTLDGLCGDLRGILEKALEKCPANRYATVEALSRDIESYLRGEPVTMGARPH